MNIVTHLQELDDLIIEHTKPPVTAMLRNKVAFCIEQAQARAADVERQEQTLARQIETIQTLRDAKAQVDAELAKLKSPHTPPSIHIINQMPESTYEPEE
jgi:hypothetical protein